MLADAAIGSPAPTVRGARSVVARSTARRAIRSGALWGYVFGAVIASSALTYDRFYRTAADRQHLAATFDANRASAALFGPARQLDTVAGFTVFKTSMTLMIAGAVWALLMSTRLLRGEEDAGRWEMLLTGQTTRRDATAQAFAGLLAGIAVLWLLTGVITVLTGRSSTVNFGVGPALYFALAMVSTALMFVAVGAFTSQLAATRRQAATYAAVLLGLSYGVRMVGDAGVGLHWLVWLSPLGWVEQLQPLLSPRPLALLPIIALTVAVGAAAVHLAGARDLGASLIPDRATTRPRLALLFGPTGLTVRLVRSTVIGWVVAVVLTGLTFGAVANAGGSSLSGSSVEDVFARLGAHASGVAAFLGVSFLLFAVLVGFAAAGQVTAARGEEAEGRLDHLVVQPVSRPRWFGGRLLVAVGAIAVCGVVAGVATWVGTVPEGGELHLGAALDAGVNVVPPAVFILGVGAAALGMWPRRCSLVVYAVLAWSLLIDILGGFSAQSRWLLDTSVFHHMAAAPAVSPNWVANGVMLALGFGGMLVGGVAFARRDMEGE
ncbi:MAG: ABC transporter permease subunit [Acidimicrobiaceae bacterium]|nr:ABC transporter permease subunit [Acidimicrobiaceae bacterium]